MARWRSGAVALIYRKNAVVVRWRNDLIGWPQSPSLYSNIGILIVKEVVICKISMQSLVVNGAEMARISAILFSRHCHRAIIFYFSAT